MAVALPVVSPLGRPAGRVLGELREGVGRGEASPHRLTPSRQQWGFRSGHNVHNLILCTWFLQSQVLLPTTSMPIKSSGRIVPPGWAPLQPKQSVLSLIV